MVASLRRRSAGLGSLSASGLLVGLALAMGLDAGTGSAARAADAATVQEILDGKELYIDSKPARVKDKAASPQQVSTGSSRAQLAFEGVPPAA
ncbi:hypothetical protein [Cyanobium sp. ATX-6F1]|uniref:hypothetical protein n=1 Tax=Cyanobium sp. ATX-6F1 TaxID=3137388 RepID=UPI0039BEB7E2